MSSINKTLSIILSFSAISIACENQEQHDKSTEDAVLGDDPSDLDEYLKWHTIVFNAHVLNGGMERFLRDRLRAEGADAVHFIPEIGVGFARFENIEDANNLRDGVSIDSDIDAVGAVRMYSIPGFPTLDDVLSGPIDPAAIHQAARPVNLTGAAPQSGAPFVQAEDELYDLQWGLDRIQAETAWQTSVGSHDSVVAIIDTGVANNHPDLAANVVHRSCFTFGSITGVEPCTLYPSTAGHGTHVAGIVAAQFGGGAAVGVGPGLGIASYNVFENFIVPALLFPAGDGDPIEFDLWLPLASDFGILSAVVDAANRGFPVMNLSLGGSWFHGDTVGSDVVAWKESWRRAILHAQLRQSAVVVSAGNDGDWSVEGWGNLGNLDNPKVTTMPAESARAITVASTGVRPFPPAVGTTDVRAFYSNFGSAVDYSAPGGDAEIVNNAIVDDSGMIMSSFIELDPFFDSIMAAFQGTTYDGPSCPATESCEAQYAYLMGTSMAAPHVAGALGLMHSVHPFHPAVADHIMRRTVDPFSADQNIGRGRLNVGAAVDFTRFLSGGR